MSQSKSKSKGKLVVVAIVFAILAVTSLACNLSDNADAAPIEPTAEPTPSQEEVDAYWDEQNAKDEIREEAIRRDAVIVEWRGDWDSNTRLALFRGQGHVSDVKVGTQYMDLVERDQIVLKEYDGENWFAVANVSNNLQPGGKVVFVR